MMTADDVEERAKHVAIIVLACLSGHESPDSLTVGETQKLCADTTAAEFRGLMERDRAKVAERAQVVFLRLWHRK